MQPAFEALPVFAALPIAHIVQQYRRRYSPAALLIIMSFTAGALINIGSAEGMAFLPVDISVTLACSIGVSEINTKLLNTLYGR